MPDRPAAPPPEPEWYRDVPRGRVLAFAPHPDDEIAGPGGCLALHRRNGDPVRVVVASTGEAGDPEGRFDPATYAALRQRESRRGLLELGIDDAVYWGQPDNCVLNETDYEFGFQLASAAITEFAPDLIYLPWEAEGHPDHHAMHLVVREAMRRTRFCGLAFGYEVWNAMVPDLVVDISAVAENKRRAIRAHESQLAYVDFEHTILGLNAYRSMVHARGSGYCEGLRRIRLD
ncbi:MAG: PIG-L family deacetylase [Planctomycetes bacterium]|nr:PIG-L family deacetylase [Planctomycetota bacterium]